jgi:protein phosphatase 1L
VTCEPEILEKEIGPEDEYLVLASDGIWDVMRNEEVAQLVLASKDFLSIARELCHEAIIMGSTDNVTALVIDLK